jgi:hypothetical protein
MGNNIYWKYNLLFIWMENEIEKWLSVVGYEGLYEVSSFGNVRRISRTRGYKPLKDYVSPKGYRITTLHKKDGGKTNYIHIMVAHAFIHPNVCCPTCGSKLEVNHKDRNKNNNRVDNLEYMTRLENVQHYHSTI